MAASGYTPILLYASGTATNVPLAANMTSSASGAELALNYADGKLYFKNSSGVVTLLAGSGGGPAGGSNTQVQYNSSGSLAGSANMVFDGTTITSAFSGPHNGTVGATTANTGSFTSLAYTTTLTGGTGVVNLGSGQFYKDASGNVGIGTSSPSSYGKFAVLNGNINAVSNSSSSSSALISQNDGNITGSFVVRQSGYSTYGAISANNTNIYTGGSDIAITTDGAYNIKFGTGSGSTERMRIDSSGNLAVGNTSALNTGGSRGNITINGTSQAILSLSSGGSTSTSGYVYYDGTNLQLWNNTASSALIFGASATERMRIDSSGNVGIGTSSPDSKLHVVGATSGTGPASIRVGYGGASTNYSDADTHYIRTGSGSLIQTLNGTTQVFTTSNTEAMRIDSSGNFLVNCTSNNSAKMALLAGGIGAFGIITGGAVGGGGGYYPMVFNNGGSTGFANGVGSISTNTTNTSFNTASDIRLKNDIGVSTNTSVIDNTVVHDFTWKIDGSTDRGVFAQEALKIKPTAVNLSLIHI